MARQLTVKMGKNKNKKQTETGNTSEAKKETPAEPVTSFVPIVSCFYCDVVSFEVSDQENYADHLMKAHNVHKNTKALLEVTLKLQSGREQINTHSQFFGLNCALCNVM